MTKRWTRNSIAVLCLCVLGLAACATAPKLQSKQAVVPAGVDLGGRWQVRSNGSAIRLPGQNARAAPIIRTSRSAQRRQSGSGRRSGSPVEVFLEFGETLKITQTQYGLFISYDRSVVEEYTFGENREVTVGPIEAQRVSGWEGDVFVIETLDHGGSRLLESWRVLENGALLSRSIVIQKGDKQLFSTLQRFDRLR
jgi:hypothetical protein